MAAGGWRWPTRVTLGRDPVYRSSPVTTNVTAAVAACGPSPPTRVVKIIGPRTSQAADLPARGFHASLQVSGPAPAATGREVTRREVTPWEVTRREVAPAVRAGSARRQYALGGHAGRSRRGVTLGGHAGTTRREVTPEGHAQTGLAPAKTGPPPRPLSALAPPPAVQSPFETITVPRRLPARRAHRMNPSASAVACGIDFGTSNSAVGWLRPGPTALLPLEDGQPTMPSAIFFHDEDTTVSHGRAALADYLAGYDGRLMRAMKNLLGSSLMDSHTEIRGRAVPFRVLLTHFIAQLKSRAEAAAGRPFDAVVMGRPAFFVDGDAAADRAAEQTLGEIARDVGFKDVAFQYEPLAAAFDYEARLDREELVLVIDIGGGTSDFSLIRLGPDRAARPDRRADILAHGGVHIGGGDFDRLLNLAAFMPLLGLGSKLRNGKDVPSTQYINLASWHTINFAYTAKARETLEYIRVNAAERDKVDLLLHLVRERAGHWLSLQVEKAKIDLSDSPTTEASLDRLAAGRTLTLTRAQLQDATAPLIDRIETTVTTLLRDAAVGADAIDTIFFTGGSSRVSCLRERIGALLPAARSVEGDLFGSIGAGLALDAARKFGY